jgi:iodotyrosine deiodinase
VRPAPRLEVPAGEGLARSRAFLEAMRTRRTVRDFSDRPVPFELIRNAVATAATAPSGANLQPWRFVAVADPQRKRRLRAAAERGERAFYGSRASAEWLVALEPLGTDWRKPFLETAPYVIVCSRFTRAPTPRPYYAKESVGIAVGLLLASLHQAGLATLTHTPSPMRWLNEILDRPTEERAFVVVPVGYAAEDATVPDIGRKRLDEVLILSDRTEGAVLDVSRWWCG